MSAPEGTGKPKPKARMQLLVRAEGDASFRIEKVESGLAYLQYRPQRISIEECEIAELRSGVRQTTGYILKNRKTEHYIQLTEHERFLWDRMDGRTSLQEMATAYVLRYGAFDFDVIPVLIAKLRRAGFLTMRPVSRLREVLARHRRNPAVRAAEAAFRTLEKMTVTSRQAHNLFERVYHYGAFVLFTPFAVAGLGLIAVLGARGAVLLWADRGEISSALAAHPIVAILLVKLFFWLTVISHQMVHALALVHYGRRVREFGFTMLHGFIPTFYADVTDIFMGSRRARLVAALAGPLVHLFLGAFYLWAASLLGPGLLKGFLAASAVLQLQSLFVSLYPFCFLEMDGYHLLVDLLGMPTLNHEAVSFVRHALWRRLAKGLALNRQEAVYVSYVFLSAASIMAFVGLNVWVLLAAGTS